MCVCVWGGGYICGTYVRQYGWVFMCGNVVKANRFFFWPLEPAVGILPMPLSQLA